MPTSESAPGSHVLERREEPMNTTTSDRSILGSALAAYGKGLVLMLASGFVVFAAFCCYVSLLQDPYWLTKAVVPFCLGVMVVFVWVIGRNDRDDARLWGLALVTRWSLYTLLCLHLILPVVEKLRQSPQLEE